MGKRPGYDWILGGDLPELGHHSVAKHEVFDRYIAAYIRTLTRNHLKRALNLTIIDGFCGGGRYSLDGTEVDGSPLRMLAAVERAQAELSAARAMGFEIKADFVFIDDNPNHIEFLRDLLQRRGHGSRIGHDIRIIRSTFENAYPTVIEAIQKRAVLIARSFSRSVRLERRDVRDRAEHHEAAGQSRGDPDLHGR
ncbi:three-Cys-motif partner protein TcmP [Sphingomonas sp. LR55]|uniref:three-Cys-motif partner protein TcmP n=1 Tax=Sphingomonas sp. LR55 TaxID=3050231 RepID=UPI002FDF7246